MDALLELRVVEVQLFLAADIFRHAAVPLVHSFTGSIIHLILRVDVAEEHTTDEYCADNRADNAACVGVCGATKGCCKPTSSLEVQGHTHQANSVSSHQGMTGSFVGVGAMPLGPEP